MLEDVESRDDFWDYFRDMRFEYLSTLFLVRLTDSDQ